MTKATIIVLAILASYLIAYLMAVTATRSFGDKKEFFTIVAGLLLLALLFNM